MFSQKIHRHIFIFSLIVIAVGLPLSRVLISSGIIILLLNWLFEKNFTDKWKRLKSNPDYLLVFSIYLIHIVWAFNTENFDWYFRDIRIKLPFLIIPLVFASSKPLSRDELKLLLHFFIAAVIAGSFFSIGRLISWKGEHRDHRYLSVFIYHIRFAIEIVIAVFCLFSFIGEEMRRKNKTRIFLYGFASAWLITFLFILQSLTAYVLLSVTGMYMVLHLLFRSKRKSIPTFALLLFLFIGIFTVNYIFSVKKLLKAPEVNINELPKTTVNGNRYLHKPLSGEIENNRHTELFICPKELEREWNRRSNFPVDSLDKKGQIIYKTIIRYMTSKGLHKDSVGVWQLNERDIALIEQGVSNHLFDEHVGAFSRLYKFFWEMELLKAKGDPNAHSILQRVEYTKTAFYIIRKNIWLGTGTGDYKDAYHDAYKEINTSLKPRYQLRAHNQILTFLLMFGIFAGMWVILAFITPFLRNTSYVPLLTRLFFIISFLSFFNEDTLETHVGVTLIAFFYALFIFGTRNDTNETIKP